MDKHSVFLVFQVICHPWSCPRLSIITTPNLEATSSPTPMKSDPSTGKMSVSWLHFYVQCLSVLFLIWCMQGRCAAHRLVQLIDMDQCRKERLKRFVNCFLGNVIATCQVVRKKEYQNGHLNANIGMLTCWCLAGIIFTMLTILVYRVSMLTLANYR